MLPGLPGPGGSPGRRRRRGAHLWLRLALLLPVLAAVLVFHASGTTLVYLRAARLVVLVMVVGAAGSLGRRGRVRAGETRRTVDRASERDLAPPAGERDET